MGDAHPNISDAELAVLKTLWKHGEGSVRQIQTWLGKRKRTWAYNTVLTLLSRLRDKGYAASEKTGQAHVFRATVTREDLLRRRLTQLAEQVCDGTASPLVHALVQGQQFSPDEIAYFRRLLDELEPRE
jgi:predicted transcriptional regulator